MKREKKSSGLSSATHWQSFASFGYGIIIISQNKVIGLNYFKFFSSRKSWFYESEMRTSVSQTGKGSEMTTDTGCENDD